MNEPKKQSVLTRLSTRKLLGDNYQDFMKEIVLVNFNRIKILVLVMLILFTVLILFDYIHFKAGKWDVSPGYPIIFICHLAAQILLIVFAGFMYSRTPGSKEQVTSFHRRINQTMILLFCFHMTFIAMGDVLINGSIAAYLGSIFAIASFVFTSNWFALQLFASNLLLMIFLLIYASRITEENYTIQIMNAVIYVAISFLLSRILFYYQSRDYKHRIQIRRQNERLEKMVMYDHLTGTLNRRSFVEQAEKELKRSERYRYPVALLTFDIDHFKLVNDTHGHAAGDSVLVSICRAIHENIRESDLFARWGGEEFILLSLETDDDQIAAIAEKLRRVIEALSPQNACAVTASFGVTCHRLQETMEETIQRADMALYQAKRSGRNCVRTL